MAAPRRCAAGADVFVCAQNTLPGQGAQHLPTSPAGFAGIGEIAGPAATALKQSQIGKNDHIKWSELTQYSYLLVALN
jgi:hypothetical protein